MANAGDTTKEIRKAMRKTYDAVQGAIYDAKIADGVDAERASAVAHQEAVSRAASIGGITFAQADSFICGETDPVLDDALRDAIRQRDDAARTRDSLAKAQMLALKERDEAIEHLRSVLHAACRVVEADDAVKRLGAREPA